MNLCGKCPEKINRSKNKIFFTVCTVGVWCMQWVCVVCTSLFDECTLLRIRSICII